MTTEPATEPMSASQELDPIDLLIAFEAAVKTPIRPEYVEGMAMVPPQPDRLHNQVAYRLSTPLSSSGIGHVGLGEGFRTGLEGKRTRDLVIPDFNVLHREPAEADEAYRRAHKGWYAIELVALAGEVTSTNHETDSGPKYRSYAAAGVPVYVLIHREQGTAFAYSDPVPEELRYRVTVEVKLGEPLPLPTPYPELDTSVALRT